MVFAPGVAAAVIGSVTCNVPVDCPLDEPVGVPKLWHVPAYGFTVAPLVKRASHSTEPCVSTGVTSNCNVLPALPAPEAGLREPGDRADAACWLASAVALTHGTGDGGHGEPSPAPVVPAGARSRASTVAACGPALRPVGHVKDPPNTGGVSVPPTPPQLGTGLPWQLPLT